MSPQDPAESFVQALTEHQNRLYGYIYSLVGNHDRTSDILQECNLVLWRKAGEFREGADFIPWAFAIARFQVMAHFRDHKRESERLVREDVAELLVEELETQAGELEDRRVHLQSCVSKLPEKSRRMVDLRYFERQPVQSVADEMEQKLSAVKVALMRIRGKLKDCIDRELSREGNA